MEFNYRYLGNSTVSSSSTSSDMSFVPDALREDTFFKGILHPKKAVLFREAMSALHDVVVDDQRYTPPDRSAYMEYIRQKEAIELQEYLAESEALKTRVEQISIEFPQFDESSF